MLRMESDGKLAINDYNATHNTNFTIDDGQPHRVVASYDGATNVRIFVDDQYEDITLNGNNAIINVSQNYIGRYGGNVPGQYASRWEGYMGLFNIYIGYITSLDQLSYN